MRGLAKYGPRLLFYLFNFGLLFLTRESAVNTAANDDDAMVAFTCIRCRRPCRFCTLALLQHCGGVFQSVRQSLLSNTIRSQNSVHHNSNEGALDVHWMSTGRDWNSMKCVATDFALVNNMSARFAVKLVPPFDFINFRLADSLLCSWLAFYLSLHSLIVDVVSSTAGGAWQAVSWVAGTVRWQYYQKDI